MRSITVGTNLLIRALQQAGLAAGLLGWSLAPATAQSHSCPTGEAVVAIEVTNTSSDGAVSRMRRFTGLLIRCDGCVLAPTAALSTAISVAGQAEEAKSQAIAVVLHPGTPAQKQVDARRIRVTRSDPPYVLLRLADTHAPAARLLLPAAVAPETELRLWSVNWDTQSTRYLAPTSAPVHLARSPEGWTAADAPEGAAAGSVLAATDGMAVGLLQSTPEHGVACFDVLGEVTNCVAPRPSATAPRDAEMVTVPAGPFDLPPGVIPLQPELRGQATACTAEYQVDRLEVTNADYLEFWKSRPAEDRRKMGYRARYYPLSWGPEAAPFPAQLERVPVLGVTLAAAAAYANWKGKRLLTPAEWCRAAFGVAPESKPPEWIRRYINDREGLWRRLTSLHAAQLDANPQVATDPGPLLSYQSLPWVARVPQGMELTAWSRRTIERALEPMQVLWRSPQAVIAGGARDFDVSECGANDMGLNAWEQVIPPPGVQFNRGACHLHLAWQERKPGRQEMWDWWGALALAGGVNLPPFSRLYRRALMGPPTPDLLLWSSLSEIQWLIAPIAGWDVRAGADLDTNATAGAPRGRMGELARVPPGCEAWRGTPRWTQREMGLEPPMDFTDQRPSIGPQLYYHLPVGFRCAF